MNSLWPEGSDVNHADINFLGGLFARSLNPKLSTLCLCSVWKPGLRRAKLCRRRADHLIWLHSAMTLTQKEREGYVEIEGSGERRRVGVERGRETTDSQKVGEKHSSRKITKQKIEEEKYIWRKYILNKSPLTWRCLCGDDLDLGWGEWSFVNKKYYSHLISHPAPRSLFSLFPVSLHCCACTLNGMSLCM